MDKLISSIVNIGIESNIQKIILFGSRSRNDHTVKSDYDIAFVSPFLTLEAKNKILEKIEELDTFHKVDVVFLDNLKKKDKLTENIINDGVILMDKFQIKFENFSNALSRLEEAILDFKKLNNLSVRDGAIQRFEFTAELAWKTTREYLLSQQVADINTPKAVMGEAFASNIIEDEDGWIQILNDRNATSHIYDEDVISEIFNRICEKHLVLFHALQKKLNS